MRHQYVCTPTFRALDDPPCRQQRIGQQYVIGVEMIEQASQDRLFSRSLAFAGHPTLLLDNRSRHPSGGRCRQQHGGKGHCPRGQPRVEPEAHESGGRSQRAQGRNAGDEAGDQPRENEAADNQFVFLIEHDRWWSQWVTSATQIKWARLDVLM